LENRSRKTGVPQRPPESDPPISPPTGPATGSFNGIHPKNNSLAALLNADAPVLAGSAVLPDLQRFTETRTNQSLALPAVANGLGVKLEFRLTSSASLNFKGFYTDDVQVTAN
jgi:hypothetical protein